ncbi:MAG: hypothetical protein AAF674_17920 [Pseudomonadota bacterium]
MTHEETTARALLSLRDGAKAIPLADWRNQGNAPTSIAGGYAAQDALTDILTGERGQHPIGYKIGATNQMARDMLDVSEPFYGRLYAEQVDGGTNLTIIEGVHLVAEPEIAVELKRDLDPSEAPFDAETIAQATGALLPAIEVIVSCLDPWTQAGGPTIIADNGAHGLWIPGQPVTDWSGFDPLDAPIAVSIDGAAPTIGRGGAVDGGPFAATAWLANALAARGRGMANGTRISTGTVTPPIPLKKGMSIQADYGALGKVSLTIAG